MQVEDKAAKQRHDLMSDALALAAMWSIRGFGNTTLMVRGLDGVCGVRPIVVGHSLPALRDIERDAKMAGCIQQLSLVPYWHGEMTERLAGRRGPMAVDHVVMAEILRSLVTHIRQLEGELGASR